MTVTHYERADDGSVRNTAVAAVMLIVAGLGLMVLDDSPVVGPAQASVLQQP